MAPLHCVLGLDREYIHTLRGLREPTCHGSGYHGPVIKETWLKGPSKQSIGLRVKDRSICGRLLWGPLFVHTAICGYNSNLWSP